MVTQQELNHYREKTVVLQMIFLEVFVDSELRSIVILLVFVYFSQEIRDPVSPDQNMDSNHWFQAVNLDQDRMRREEEVGAGLNLDPDRMRREEEVGAGLNLDLDRMRRKEELGAGLNLDLDGMRREEEVGAGLNLDLDRMRREEEVGAGLHLELDRMRREEEVGAGLNREKMRLVFRSCFSSGRGNQWFHLLSLQPQPSLISTNIQGKNYSNL